MTLSEHPIVAMLQSKKLQVVNPQLSAQCLTFSLSVKAKPNARKEGVSVSDAGELVIATRAQPIEGRANESIVEALSDLFGIAARDIQLLRGERGRSKVFAITLQFRHNRDSAYFLQKLEHWK